MTINKSFGYTDSVTTGKQVTIPDLSYSADFCVTENQPNECILTNTTTPIDQYEHLRIGVTSIKDVYQGTGIDPAYCAPTRNGFSAVSQVNDIIRVTADEDPTFVVDLPVSAHIVVKGAKNQHISASDYLTVALRAVAGLFGTGETDASRIDEIIRGALLP